MLRRLGNPRAGGHRAACARGGAGAVHHSRRGKRTAGRAAAAAPRGRAGSASTPCGTTTFITRRLWRPRGIARRTTRTTSARRRNGCRWRSGDSCIRASGTRGRRGGAARRTRGLAPCRFITFLENHDQIANTPTGRGERTHQSASPGHLPRADGVVAAVARDADVLSGPGVCRVVAILYFADHGGPLGAAVRAGRAQFMSQFQSTASRVLVDELPDPADEATFRRCKLRHAERQANTAAVALHRDLLRLRREDPVFRDACPAGWTAPCCRIGRSSCDGLPSDPHAGRGRRSSPPAIGWWSSTSELTCISVSAPEPLLAPPAGTDMGDPVVERGSGIWRRRHGSSGNRGGLAHSRSGDCRSLPPVGV